MIYLSHVAAPVHDLGRVRGGGLGAVLVDVEVTHRGRDVGLAVAPGGARHLQQAVLLSVVVKFFCDKIA